MTTHHQHTEAAVPQDDAATDYPPPMTDSSPAEFDSTVSNESSTEPPPLETQAMETRAPETQTLDTRSAEPQTLDTQSAETRAPETQTLDTQAVDAPGTERDLFAEDELAGLRARWDNVQAAFVDDPRECVQKADGLVSDVVKQLTAGFTDARSRLEEQWARGEEASTEDLRVALKQYREFFQRLLAV